MSDQYEKWRALLADPRLLGTEVEISETPEAGFWRAKGSNGLYSPVAFWWGKDGELRCRFNGNEVTDLNRMTDLWTRAARHPVSRQAYQDAVDGKGWADVDETVAEQVRGSNVADIPPEILFRDEVASALAALKNYGSIASDAIAAKAQSLRARLLELAKLGKQQHDEEKAPHLRAGQEVDRKWNPIIKDAQEGADQLRRLIGSWETAKLEEQRRQEREAAAAAAVPLPEPEPLKAQVRGGYGKAASVRTKRIVSRVTDWPALAGFYLHVPEVQAILIGLANRDLAGNAEPPGIEVKEIADVR